MKILICSTTFSSITHGPSKFVNNLLNDPYLREKTQIRILTKDIKNPVHGKIYKYENHLPRIFGSLWEYQENYSLYRGIEKILEEFEPDFIVFNNALTSLWTTIKLSKSNAKLIGFIQDAEKLLAGTQYPLLSRLRIHAIKSRFLEIRASTRLDGIITCSRYLENFVSKEYLLSQEKVHLLYQGVDISKFTYFDRAANKIDRRSVIKILFVKSNFIIGGLSQLLTSLNLLKEYSFKLVVCGSFPFHKINHLLLQESNVEIDFRGATDQNEVVALMKDCDILSIPSLREGLGVANIEGLATGIPVVSTKVGGIPEVLGHGKYGWLADPDDPSDLAKVLKECINSPEERLKRSRLGRQHVESLFNKEDMAINFYNILKSIN